MCCGSTVNESFLLGSGNVGGVGETEIDKAKWLGPMFLPFASLWTGIFFGGIGGADFDFGGTTSSSWIKGVFLCDGERVVVDRSDMSFLGGGRGRVLREAAGEGGGCHW
jgi:hypothetical protein